MQRIKGYGAHVLYLDFDGVLHPHDVWMRPLIGPQLRGPVGHTLFEHAELLEKLLAPYPSLRIVLSTTWAAHLGQAKATLQLRPALRARVIGMTYRRQQGLEPFLKTPRAQQVLADAARRQPKRWLAIDDQAEGWPEGAAVVLTDPVEGLGSMQSQELLKSLLATVTA